MEAPARAFAILNWRTEDIFRCDCVFLSHQNFKPGAGPSEVLPHSSRCVSLDHCLNASIFERALRQVRRRAATVGLEDYKLGAIHGQDYKP
jgi:hypothetical protein